MENAPPQAPPTGVSAIDKQEVFGWAMFDFANSSFTTVIVTVAYSVYFTNVVAPEGRGDFYWALAGNLALLVVLLTSPLLGALADFSGSKKRFLLFSYLGCVFFTALLYFVGPGDVGLGMGIFILAKICFSTGENFTAAFLPDISPPESMGKVSGFAWALGFFGGIACLVLCGPLMGGLSDPAHAETTRWIGPAVAAFFLVSGIPTFWFLKERGVASELPEGESMVSVGFSSLKETLGQVQELKELVKFLGVFTIFNSGLSVVVYFTAIYAEREVGFGPAELSQFFILTNLVAAAGAAGFGVLQDKIGAKKAINLTLILWMVATVGAYLSHEKWQFWMVGLFAGSALGATQSGSRALVGEFSPPSRSAEFFGFWGLFWKLSEGIGPMAFGIISMWAGSRSAILFTTLFFIFGFLGMLTIDHEKGIEEAERYEARTWAQRHHEEESKKAAEALAAKGADDAESEASAGPG